jgi:hypothetical protein
LAVLILALRAVDTAFPASKQTSELWAGEVFNRLHGPAAKRTGPTRPQRWLVGIRKRSDWIFCNQESSADRDVLSPVTVSQDAEMTDADKAGRKNMQQESS